MLLFVSSFLRTTETHVYNGSHDAVIFTWTWYLCTIYFTCML